MGADDFESLREAYRLKKEKASVAPWRSIPIHIGGITAVGFGVGTELLLVKTHSGLGVVEVETGATIARMSEADIPADEAYPVSSQGIGPLRGQRIALAGLWGGGLRTIAPDGWAVHRIAPNWPAECVVLLPPEYPDLEDVGKTTMLLKDVEPCIRAVGFSDSGKSLVAATTELFLWYRD